jgi:hypothetical protein
MCSMSFHGFAAMCSMILPRPCQVPAIPCSSAPSIKLMRLRFRSPANFSSSVRAAMLQLRAQNRNHMRLDGAAGRPEPLKFGLWAADSLGVWPHQGKLCVSRLRARDVFVSSSRRAEQQHQADERRGRRGPGSSGKKWWGQGRARR